MRFSSIAIVVASALSVFAQTSSGGGDTLGWSVELLQTLAKVPPCAASCLTATLPQSRCPPTDVNCLCEDKEYQKSTEGCVLSVCSVKEALTTESFQKQACKAPFRDTGISTRRISIGLVTTGGGCLILRFLARWQLRTTNIGWDDWTILLAWLFLIPSTVIFHIMTYKGMGRDIWTVSFDDITAILKYFWIEQFLYQLTIVLTKVSIVLLYLRVLPKEVSTKFARTCHGIIIALLVYGASFMIAFCFQCRPINLFWTQWDGEHKYGTCATYQIQVGLYVNSAINIAFDFIVFILPVPKLLGLSAQDSRPRVAVAMIFVVGLFVTVCSMVRLQYISLLGAYSNATYHYNELSLWSSLEGTVGVICACLPTIVGPVLYFFREKIGGRITRFTKSGSGKSKRSSRGLSDRTIERLSSNASDRDLELGGRDTKQLGGIERTTLTSVTSMYNLPPQARIDGVELIEHYSRREDRGKHPWEMIP